MGANSAAMLMDNLTYHYGSDDNKLLYIDDSQTNQNAYVGDLEDQASGNYDYDEIGNLIQDVRDSIDNIAWTNYQKISTIEKTDRAIRYRYNPMQQRVAKYVRVGDSEKRTYYVRDAQGNVMAAYSAWMDLGAGITWDSAALSEQHIYGSSRVGYAQAQIKLYPEIPVNA